jgi:hypothetical protein
VKGTPDRRRVSIPRKLPRRVPEGALEALHRHLMYRDIDLHRLDSEFQDDFANAASTHLLPLLERYCLNKLDILAESLLPVATSRDPNVINPQFAEFLDVARERTLANAAGFLSGVDSDLRSGFLNGLAIRLEARRFHWLAEAKTRHLARHPAPIVHLPRPVTSAIIARRRALVRSFRSENGYSAVQFARLHLGYSETVVLAIIKEQTDRFADDARVLLLKKLGVSLEDWYSSG